MADRTSSNATGALALVRLGTVSYARGLEIQAEIAAARGRGLIPDVLLLLEHEPVYTKGRRTDPRELGMGEDWYRAQGIEVADSDRGGSVTYHGPGQLVAYPILDLATWGSDVRAYVERLERVTLAALGEHGVPAQVIEGLTGVWTAGEPPIAAGAPGPQGTAVGTPSLPGGEARKIASIGIHVSRGITTHGLAVNVSNDLQPFEWILPCGIEAVRMTSLTREHGAEQNVAAFGDTVATHFGEVFGLAPEPLDLEAVTASAREA